jgi:hypothetical protein
MVVARICRRRGSEPAQLAPDFDVDQRINWRVSEAQTFAAAG